MKLPVTKTKIDVCQSDTGALGHIANWAYVKYMQIARSEFMAEITATSGYDNSPLVANVNVDFLSACYPNDNIEVITWCSALGKKSFKVCSEIYANGKVAVRGTATCVGLNRDTGQTEKLPQQWQPSNYSDTLPCT